MSPIRGGHALTVCSRCHIPCRRAWLKPWLRLLLAWLALRTLASDDEAHGAGPASTLLFLQEPSSEIGGDATAFQGDRQADPAATNSG